ncbi:GntR family transcriptional regulator [Pseudomonas putida]|uniref:GntR family transcriptional regulator n=2 Tax=Pseudomonas TaxID=286 RepID=A0A1L5PSQ9_PSEPU|nr:GntR family transcriptional regulator [Pseudomonas putida]MBA6136193.1 GntR family transcriptional regulator [Pseudomonas monteilii]MBF8806172.1 GntR family transcriptional regulator [Pseudomonas asiatica]MDO1494146.1 GntR family transcriptional regulator [Pseudomonas putida]POG02852.1 GntR family transcriptional regulator [Pseudomonas putida]
MKKHLNDQLFEIIAESIRSGQLKVGTLLLEGPLAELFGVSRSPVRQALLSLQQARLICTFEGRGYLVGPLPGAVLRRKLGASDFRFTEDNVQAPRKTEAWQAVYNQIERDLLHQSLFGIYHVNELELSRYYSISRTVSNQVLTRLSLMGLVERDERSRWQLWQWDEGRVGELFEVRRHLEPYVLKRAAAFLQAEQLDSYIERLHRAMEIYPNMDSRQLDELESDLHIETLGHCPNRQMLQILRRTHSLLLSAKHILLDKSYFPDEEPFFREHLSIFENLRGGCVDLAAQSMEEHLVTAERKIKQRLAHFRAHNRIAPMPYLDKLT